MMRAALVFALLCAASSAVAQQITTSGGSVIPVFATVAGLPTTALNGAIAFAANCRAVSGVAGLNAGLAVQAAGAGTGCIVSFTTNGNVWQVAGTASTASQ